MESKGITDPPYDRVIPDRSRTTHMPRIEVTVPAPDGECSATLHTPDGSGPWPAVIVFPDAGGVRETFRAMADRLAGLGYATLLPDVYYRYGGFEPFDMDTVFSDPDQRNRLMEMVGSLTNDKIVADAGAFLDFLAGRPEVTGDGVGTTGYCMGGRASMIVAGSHPERVAAAASFHGGRLAVEDDPTSPHLLADREGHPEVGQPDAARGVDQHVFRLVVPVAEAEPVHGGQPEQ